MTSYRSEAEEASNAESIPVRASVTQLTTELPTKAYTGPESMLSFEEWVLSKPLGRQMLNDPPEIVDKLHAAYERHIAHLVSLQGGSFAQKCVYSTEWRENRLQDQEQGEEAARKARPDSRTGKYADLKRQPLRMRPCHGDIPTWAPKSYETDPSDALEGSSLWPQVSVTGRNTYRPKRTQLAATELGNARIPVLSDRNELRRADVRLAVPPRETLGNKHMASHLLSINRKIDHHGQLVPHTGNTPLFCAHSTRAIAMPRGGRVC